MEKADGKSTDKPVTGSEVKEKATANANATKVTPKEEALKEETASAEVKSGLSELSEDDFDSSFFETEIEDLENQGVDEDYVIDANMYSPSLEDEKAVNREYKSQIRFLKNPRRTKDNGKRNIVSKFVVFMDNPNNPNSKIMVDDISHINRDNIITNAFFHCRNSKSLAIQNLGKKNFSRRSYNWTLIKVEKDFQHPEFEDNLKIFRFANQVDEILTKALVNKPEDDIFAKLYSDPIKGYKFILNINEREVDSKYDKDAKMTMVNYTDSRFVDQPSPLMFNDVPADWTKDRAGMMAMHKHIMANCPVLEDYEPKAWDQETEELVIEAVRKVIDDATEFEKIYYKTYKKNYYKDNSGASAKIPSVNEVDEFKEKTASLPADDDHAVSIDDDEMFEDINI